MQVNSTDILNDLTLCSVDGDICGHLCNAFCGDWLHCLSAYGIDDKGTLAQDQGELGPRVVRLELVAEQIAWGDRQDAHLFTRSAPGPAKYQYLVWIKGCDPQCPRILASQPIG